MEFDRRAWSLVARGLELKLAALILFTGLPALAALLSGLFIGIFAGLLPARSAARKGIVEAVQYE